MQFFFLYNVMYCWCGSDRCSSCGLHVRFHDAEDEIDSVNLDAAGETGSLDEYEADGDGDSATSVAAGGGVAPCPVVADADVHHDSDHGAEGSPHSILIDYRPTPPTTDGTRIEGIVD